MADDDDLDDVGKQALRMLVALNADGLVMVALVNGMTAPVVVTGPSGKYTEAQCIHAAIGALSVSLQQLSSAPRVMVPVSPPPPDPKVGQA